MKLKRWHTKYYTFCIFAILLFLQAFPLQGQEKEKKIAVSGYIKDMQTLWIPKNQNNWTTDNLLHNRLNLRYFTTHNITTVIEARNRFMWGELVEVTPDSLLNLNEDKGFFDLSETISSDESYVLHTMIDRAYIDFTFNKLQITAGRQRINWGMNLIWNPNDVFNTYSFFDFDYEERPGTDAIRAIYYPGYTSSVEIAYQYAEKYEEMALAGLYKFNKWNYDFQFLGGYVRSDYILGTGWSGQIAGGGFRGEATYFYPQKSFSDTSGIFSASISGDYTFSNSLYIHSALLFNSDGTTGKAGALNILNAEELSAKQLSAAKYSIFGQASYPITPLINTNLSCIYNPTDNSVFTGPTFTFSLANNLEWMLAGQLFFGEPNTEFGNYGKLFFARFRFSF